MKNTSIFVTGAAAAICGIASFFVFTSKKPEAPADDEVVIKADVKSAGATRDQHIGQSVPTAAGDVAVEVKLVLPTGSADGYDDEFDLTEDEWSRLTAAEKRIYSLLHKAFDEDDRKSAIAMVKQLQALPEYPDDISLPLRKLLAENLGWFGPETLPQLLNTLSDPDAEVREMAAESYAEIVQDPDLTEQQLSSIIVAGAQVIEDVDVLSGIFAEINDCNMQNSTAVNTMISIMESGSKPAKEALQEAINDFTGTDEEDGLLDTPEKLLEWLEKAEAEDDEPVVTPAVQEDEGVDVQVVR